MLLDLFLWDGAGTRAAFLEGHRQIEKRSTRQGRRENRDGKLGKRVYVGSHDLDSECSKTLVQLGRAITGRYNGQLNPGSAQQRYGDLTDHIRNGVAAKDAVLEAPEEGADAIRAGDLGAFT